MDFERLKKGMSEIVGIAESVPEPFKERCFETLLNALLAETGEQRPPAAPRLEEAGSAGATKPLLTPPPATPSEGGTLPVLKGHVRAFMARTKLAEEKLAKVVSYLDHEIYFIREPKPAKVSQGQIEWALLSALKNAIDGNGFTVDGDAVREVCDEKGFLDPNNFWAIFARNGDLFTKPLTKDDRKQTLSNDGQTKLAELIEALAGR